MKPCPYCAKEIQDEVTLCQYCNSDLTNAPPPGEPVQPKTSGKAIASLVLGIFCLKLAAAVLAVLFGHWSRYQIRRSAGRLKGNGIALAGLILGYSGIAIISYGIIFTGIPNLRRSRMAAGQASAVGSLRTINTAAITYASTYVGQGYPSSLAVLAPPKAGGEISPQAAGLIDEVLASGSKSGYTFIYTPGERESNGRIEKYTIHASPITPGTTGNNYYFTDESGVIRQETDRQATAKSPPIG